MLVHDILVTMVTKWTQWPPLFFAKIHVWFSKGVFVPNLRKIHGVKIVRSHYLSSWHIYSPFTLFITSVSQLKSQWLLFLWCNFSFPLCFHLLFSQCKKESLFELRQIAWKCTEKRTVNMRDSSLFIGVEWVVMGTKTVTLPPKISIF